MDFFRLLLPGILLITGGCYQRHTEPREPFTLRGHVSDCITGQPLEGVVIHVQAYDQPSMGFFGVNNAEAGNALTNATGDYELIPYAYSWTYDFDIIAGKEGVSSDLISVYKRDIMAAHARTFDVDSLCLKQ